MSLPGNPVQSHAVLVVVVMSVQVGAMATVVPPRAMIQNGTVASDVVVVIVERRERLV